MRACAFSFLAYWHNIADEIDFPFGHSAFYQTKNVCCRENCETKHNKWKSKSKRRWKWRRRKNVWACVSVSTILANYLMSKRIWKATNEPKRSKKRLNACLAHFPSFPPPLPSPIERKKNRWKRWKLAKTYEFILYICAKFSLCTNRTHICMCTYVCMDEWAYTL